MFEALVAAIMAALASVANPQPAGLIPPKTCELIDYANPQAGMVCNEGGVITIVY